MFLYLRLLSPNRCSSFRSSRFFSSRSELIDLFRNTKCDLHHALRFDCSQLPSETSASAFVAAFNDFLQLCVYNPSSNQIRQQQQQQQQSIKSIWIQIPVEKSEFVKECHKLGLRLHHAQDNYILMNKWMGKESESHSLPGYATNYTGVGAWVVDEASQKVLVVREKAAYGASSKMWKLPGGSSDVGEHINATAEREVFEETGIKAEYQSLICFRQLLDFRYGKGDMYFVARLKPLTLELNYDPVELSECQWMPVSEYVDHHLKNYPQGMNALIAKIATSPPQLSQDWTRTEFRDTMRGQQRHYFVYHRQ